MKRALFFLLLASCARSPTPDLVCMQVIDRNGLSQTISSKERLKNYKIVDFQASQPYKQVMRIYAKHEGKIPAVLTSYHPNGNLWQYLDIEDARAHGRFFEYYPNGALKIKAYVIGGPSSFVGQEEWLFDRECLCYSDNGALLSCFTYVKGSLEGESFYYHPNGALAKVLTYKDNALHGMAREYSASSELLSEITYQKGLKKGESFAWHAKDQLFSKEIYHDGALQEGEYFDKSGKEIARVQNGIGKKVFMDNDLLTFMEYSDGKPEGAVCIYQEKTLLRSYFLKEGEKEGEEMEYFKGKPILSLHWQKGEIHGQVKTFYETGKVESQKEYAHNKKNGPSLTWYENGDLMLLEEYEDELLKKGLYYKIGQKEPVSKVIDSNGCATLFQKEGAFLQKIRYEKGKPIYDM